VNGESDGFPGLVLDRYAHILVAKVYTRAWKPWLTTVLDLTRKELPDVTTVVQRSSRNLQIPEKGGAGGGVSDGAVLAGEAIGGDERIAFHENGLKFETEPVRGQKTGFFLDQRENRERVRALANGRDMLNVFSFSGAFSVYAAAGGARSITDVDISRHALASAERNFRLNREIPAVAAAAAQREAVKADAFRWLEEAVEARRRWGLIVIDPPSLAPRAADREAGMRAYRRLLRAGLQLVEPGGDLVFASCSSQVRPDDFVALVDRELRAHAALDFRRTGFYGHAADHPATFPEAEYLKAVFLRRGAG
jgi:23S rRNA (cytosine1962-C5)-methyltransferase